MMPDLHKFERDLTNIPPPGSNAPPRTIRAKNLDDNYRKITLLPGEGSPPLYDVRYTKDGTRITRLLPSGSNQGDLLYYNGTTWVVLPAVQSSTLHILGIKDGALQWVETQDCPA